MIDPKHLMIGNYVIRRGQRIQIESASASDGMDYIPILITHDVLIEFGFDQDRDDQSVYNLIGGMVYLMDCQTINYRNIDWSHKLDIIMADEIWHFHQLQNVLFCNCQYEITPNED